MLSSAAKYAQLSYCLLKKDTVGIDSGIKAKIEIKNEEINYYFNVLQLSRQDYYEREPVLQAFYTNDPSLIDSEFISWRLASTTVLNALREAVITIQTSGIFRPKINLIGHGVSGVYAVLAAKELSETSIKAEIRVFTFGQPKIGDVEFAKSINRLTRKNLQVFRVTNGNDFLPRLPLIGGDIELVHHIEEYWISEDCDCAGQDRIYKCEGTILNERTGEITENKECNNSFMSLGLMESHNGPYLGYEMGRCPV
ncbi:hypothetical protein G9A89_009154 [Geosiphon pyriformis]|nr:hypothetical protein G9A89_009154 [Geosiphon pyriformis]